MKKTKQLTPFHTKEGKLKFSYRAISDMVFIFPTPPPKRLGKRSLIVIPEAQRKGYQDSTGILLSVGPGYYNKRGDWLPTTDQLKPGLKVLFDNSVPWGTLVEGVDGKKHSVVLCGVQDIRCIIED